MVILRSDSILKSFALFKKLQLEQQNSWSSSKRSEERTKKEQNPREPTSKMIEVMLQSFGKNVSPLTYCKAIRSK